MANAIMRSTLWNTKSKIVLLLLSSGFSLPSRAEAKNVSIPHTWDLLIVTWFWEMCFHCSIFYVFYRNVDNILNLGLSKNIRKSREKTCVIENYPSSTDCTGIKKNSWSFISTGSVSRQWHYKKASILGNSEVLYQGLLTSPSFSVSLEMLIVQVPQITSFLMKFLR